mmetsp:Transcript_3012/g.4679  ORF Transcript_3012/g.4679 Transcript_3012/m.4679 type:complete len:117 (+) Transcript_3012:201-551(+)
MEKRKGTPYPKWISLPLEVGIGAYIPHNISMYHMVFFGFVQQKASRSPGSDEAAQVHKCLSSMGLDATTRNIIPLSIAVVGMRIVSSLVKNNFFRSRQSFLRFAHDILGSFEFTSY